MTSSKLAALGLLVASGCNLDGGGGGGGEGVAFTRGYAFVRDREIFVADSKDYQSARKLTSSAPNSEPALAADGRTVVFVHVDEATTRSSLRKVAASGGAESEVVPGSASRQVSQPRLSPDGSLLVFIGSAKGASTVTTVKIDGSGEAAVPQSTKDTSPSFYPDLKSVLVFTGPDNLTRNELTRLELTAGTRASRLAGLAEVPIDTRAALSPDGKQIAYVAKVSGKPKIFVAPEAGGAAKQVSTTDGNDASPTWVSDTRLGFTSDSGGQSNVYEVEAAGGSNKLTVPVAAQGSFGGK